MRLTPICLGLIAIGSFTSAYRQCTPHSRYVALTASTKLSMSGSSSIRPASTSIRDDTTGNVYESTSKDTTYTTILTTQSGTEAIGTETMTDTTSIAASTSTEAISTDTTTDAMTDTPTDTASTATATSAEPIGSGTMTDDATDTVLFPTTTETESIGLESTKDTTSATTPIETETVDPDTTTDAVLILTETSSTPLSATTNGATEPSTSTPDATSSTVAPPVATFNVVGGNSLNTNVNGQQLWSLNGATNPTAIYFKISSGGWGQYPFSIEDSTSYLMTNGLYVCYDTSGATLSVSPAASMGTRKPVICTKGDAGSALSCHPEGYNAVSRFYVLTTRTSTIALYMVDPTTNPFTVTPVDLIIQ